MGRALIVSAGANSNEYIAARLSEMGYSRPVIIPSGAEARRRMSESDFELIVVNAPLPDEFGHELCITAVEQTDAGVVFLVKAAQAEQLLAPLNEQGVLLLSKPFTTPLFLQAMHMAAASNHRLQRLRQENARLQDKIGQLRLVSRAKCCLVEHAHMTEAEAHRYLENRLWTPAATAPRWRRRCWRNTLTEANKKQGFAPHPQGKGCAGSVPFMGKFYSTTKEGIFLWQNLFL